MATWWFWVLIMLTGWLATVIATVSVWVFRTIGEARHGIRRGSRRPADRHPEGV